MDRFRSDYDLVWAHVWSTVYPHTLRFPGYNDDDKQEVEAYQKSIESWIGRKIFIPDLRTTKQEVWVAQIITESNAESHVKVDAAVTQMHDRAIALLTADCSPILLFDPTQKVIGWIHGSTNAIKNRVIENTFCLLEEELNTKREDVRVFIWSTICQDHYEVSEWDEQWFQDINVKLWEEWKVLLDIRGEVVYRLWEQWVSWSNIISPAVCTYGRLDKFSFRRKTHLEVEKKPFSHANNGNVIWFSE